MTDVGRAWSRLQRDVREYGVCMALGHSWLEPTDPESPRFECLRCGDTVAATAATQTRTVMSE